MVRRGHQWVLVELSLSEVLKGSLDRALRTDLRNEGAMLLHRTKCSEKKFLPVTREQVLAKKELL